MHVTTIVIFCGLLPLSLASSASATTSPASAPADFAIRDGDTVIFLGDSITAEGTYGRIIEDYTLLRFPKRRVQFINAGVGGDTAEGGLKRLDNDVLDRGATLVTVAYGINDIGWGTKADDEHRQKYLDAVRGIVQRCKARHVRVYICSAAVTATDPDKTEHDFLQRMCDDGMQISRDAGEGAIDVQRAMRQIQRRIKAANAGESDAKKHETLHAADGVHLNELGQTAMAFAILKGLGAPAEVSSVEIDAAKPQSAITRQCEVTNLEVSGHRVTFDRVDEGLPINFGMLGALRFRFIPIPDELNRYMLAVKHLLPGSYDLHVDGRAVGTYSADQLAAGVNISSATPDGWVPGGTWDAQAALLKMITAARGQVEQSRKYAPDYLARDPKRDQLGAESAAVNDQIVQLQRHLAAPVPYHFEITRKPEH